MLCSVNRSKDYLSRSFNERLAVCYACAVDDIVDAVCSLAVLENKNIKIVVLAAVSSDGSKTCNIVGRNILPSDA